MLLKLEDNISLKDIEEQESMNPSLPIITTASDMPVYESRVPPSDDGGDPILTDFGQMRFAEEAGNNEWCMPDLYRAPEVLLKLPFSFPINVWSIGIMVSRKPREPLMRQFFGAKLTCFVPL